MPAPPWHTDSGVDAVARKWLASGYVRPCLAADKVLEAGQAIRAPIPEKLGDGLRDALAKRGITQLFSHQAAAFEQALLGRHVVVSTPTSSGKSLCFHLPVLHTLAQDPQSRALYVFPTKALSRDQEKSVGQLISDARLAVGRVVYDGDTPADARRAARDRGAIVITNPDMLSASILPHHAIFARLFQGLAFVVIDELHTYRGVFGSHMAHVVARLVRIAKFHGSHPVFICATATIGNPREHAARLLGVREDEIVLADRSGAPQCDRRFFFFNPPVVNAELGIRASYLKSAVMLASDLVQSRVPTIVFGPSRNSVEIMLKYLRDRCAGLVPEESLVAYRGGYLPEMRRRIERDLQAGKILAVVATNALELGIDIGSLDAVVCAGYPGSIAAMWQRFGRAGRRRGKSLLVLVASSAPVDQFFAQNPQLLLGAAIEHARIDPSNVEIAIQHLKCAAFELPFACGPEMAPSPERYACLDEQATRDALRFLGQHGVVHEAKGRFHWAADAYPANHVSLRNVGWDNVAIIDKSAGRMIAELDWRAAHTMLHEQAIYQHEAEQFQVETLDYENHKAYVTRVTPDYFTEAMVSQKVSVIEKSASCRMGDAEIAWGEVSVVEKVVGYKKIKFHTHENAGYGDVRLPDMQMHTTAFFITVPCEIMREMGRAAATDALCGIGRAFETVSGVSLMCEPSDIGRTLEDKAPESSTASSCFGPTLFFYDRCPGGIGLSERIYETAEELIERTLALVAQCQCECGCPACVGPSSVVALRKANAIKLLRRLGAGQALATRSIPTAHAGSSALTA
jgi:DEAD/DEAH box helicase domain-containing protein